MPTTIRSTDILFDDGTIQTTAAVATPSVIPSGTVMLFAQTAAPTGFTKNTSTGNNTALRLVTGTASTGGSVAFTTAFASQTPTGTVSVSGSAGNTTLSIPQIPSHSHPMPTFTPAPQFTFGNGFSTVNSSDRTNTTGPLTTNAQGGGGSHNHPLTISSATFSGSAINLAVSYVDVIRATKD